MEFLPIDLGTHGDLCVRFRVDAHVCSFGNADRFHRDHGPAGEGYLAWLGRRMREMPGSCVHAWSGGRVVGQIDMGRCREEPALGYVNLYYLIPERRGSGLAAGIDAYACGFLNGQGFRAARLSVSPSNARAVRFYERRGWQNLGPRPGRPEVLWMERDL